MGSVKRLRDKVYRIVYDIPSTDGKRKQKRETLCNVTKPEAEETLAKRKDQAKHPHAPQNPNITVAELFGEFFQIKRRTLSASALERYEGLFHSYIGPSIGDVKVSDLRPEHLTDAYAKWSAKGVSGRPLSGRTVHHLHDLTRCALNFGVRREWVARNVAASLESEDLPKATKPEPIALDEVEMATLLTGLASAMFHQVLSTARAGGSPAARLAGAPYSSAVKSANTGLRVTFCHGRVGSGRNREGLSGSECDGKTSQNNTFRERTGPTGIPELGFDSRPSHEFFGLFCRHPA
jgi:hypothetical protein